CFMARAGDGIRYLHVTGVQTCALPISGHTPSGSCGQSAPAASARYSVKFSVVPDSSERFTGVIGVSGSCTPGFSAAIAGSFQVVICRLKTFAIVAGDIRRESTPSRLNTTAIGEM